MANSAALNHTNSLTDKSQKTSITNAENAESQGHAPKVDCTATQKEVLVQFELTPKAWASFSPGVVSTLGKVNLKSHKTADVLCELFRVRNE